MGVNDNNKIKMTDILFYEADMLEQGAEYETEEFKLDVEDLDPRKNASISI